MMDKLNEWKKLAEAATPGPWGAYLKDSFADIGENIVTGDGHCLAVVGGSGTTDDAIFMAAAREAVPELIAEIERIMGLVRVNNELQRDINELKGVIGKLMQGKREAVPIESAPDNTYVMVKHDGTWIEAILEDGAWHCAAGAGRVFPTHWVHLPKEVGP